ncbi:MAG: CAP domain-containing protein [Candidatus Melainabacteria bacterium]|nr:MAG: CAP domain-containing protein [Candidatus Melainabacteria bacterium]
MKSPGSKYRLRRVIALAALLPYLTTGNLSAAIGASSTKSKFKSKSASLSQPRKASLKATEAKVDSKPRSAVFSKDDSKSGSAVSSKDDSKSGSAVSSKDDSKPGSTVSSKDDSKPATVVPLKVDSKPASSVPSKTNPKDFAPLFAAPEKAQTAPLPTAATSGKSSAPPASAPAPGNGSAQGDNKNAQGDNRNAQGDNKNAQGDNKNAQGDNKNAQSDNRNAQGDNKGPLADSYPSVGRMEHLTFGASYSDSPIEQRLTKLETAIYQKSFADMSLFDRTQQLKKTLLGNDDEPTADIDNLRFPSSGWPGNPLGNSLITGDPTSSEFDYYGGLAQRPENQQSTTIADMKEFMLELINSERSKSGLAPLTIDSLADKLAQEQNDELCRRNVISHANLKGENPDRRYTVNGGTGALTESIVSNKTLDTFSKSPTRAAVAELMKTLMSRQDDRDAILNQDATHIGLCINWTPGKDKLIAVTEVITNHGIIPELPKEVALGEKLEIKGVVMQPYQFDRITLAWEANKGLAAVPDESDEALPYFPPLDYVAYATKSSKDYSGAMSALRTAGVLAAIAGGVFVPPVALAAPLIAMSGGVGNSDPKPVSDIPIHGGVKVEGLTFNGKVPINKDGKEGIYYVTIWGTLSKTGKPVPISRRAILAKHVDEDVSARIETPTVSANSSDSTDNSHDEKDLKEEKKKQKHHKSDN